MSIRATLPFSVSEYSKSDEMSRVSERKEMNLRLNKYVVMPWHWITIPVGKKLDLRYGILHRKLTGSIVELLDNPVDKDVLQSIRLQQEVIGRMEQAMYLAHGFKRDRDRLFTSYDLSHDGVVEAPMILVGEIYQSLISDFSDYVVSANRLIEKMNSIVTSLFAKGSQEQIDWRETTNKLFDSSLAYALFDQYRNEIEHGFCPISVVNYDLQEQRVGVALNLEAGILQKKSVKSKVRNRLLEYRRERMRNKQTPWLSIASLSKEYDCDVCLLYVVFLLMMGEELLMRSKEHPFSLVRGANCIYWCVENDAVYEDYSIDRVYPIKGVEYLREVYPVLMDVKEYLLGQYPESKEMNRVVRGLIESAEKRWPLRGFENHGKLHDSAPF